MKIVILDGYTINPGDNPWSPVEALGECTVYDRTPPELVLERARGAEIILTSKVKLTEAIISELSGLRYISLLATGYNNVDVAAAARRGIPVCQRAGLLDRLGGADRLCPAAGTGHPGRAA